MKLLPAILLLAAAVGTDASIRLPDPSWAIEVKPDHNRRQLLESSSFTLDEDVDCKKIFSCANCTYSRVCRPNEDGSLKHFTDIACPTDRPYCDVASGTCVNTASLQCGAQDDDFICLEKNHFFPDEDCHKFHYCDEQYRPKLFQCIGDGTVYNAAEQRCVSQIDESSCGKFECDGNTLKKMKHTNFPRYFAMCKKDTNNDSPLVVGVCPPYYQINLSTQVCEPDCDAHGQGNIPDSVDCTKYYSCSETELPNGSKYMRKTAKTCPTGNSFDKTLFMCVPDPSGKICKKE